MIAHPRFSPDGEFLYFTRGTLKAGGFVLFRVPAIGGPETPVLDDVDTEISFSPDGRSFAFMRGVGAQTHIVIAAADSGGQRVLAVRQGPLAFGFVSPAWSPDGTWVAASGTDSESSRSSIILLPVDGGPARELYSTTDRVGAVRWMPDGSGLLTVLSETLSRQFAPWQGGFTRFSGGSVWRISYPEGKAERLTSDLAEYDPCCIEVASNGRMILGVLNSSYPISG
jgi:Tol biopolymer transport system component